MIASAWIQQQIGHKQLFELGKFGFTAGTATLAFLAAAEKINAPSEWKDALIVACLLLLAATILAAAMVVAAAPHTPNVDAASEWPIWTTIVWFVLWTAGAALGLAAVLPDPNPSPNPASG